MRRFTVSRALRDASAFALAAAIAPQLAHAQAAPPAAPAAAEEDVANKEIVVTGTILRGTAPVGSSVVSVNAADIQKTGLLSTTDVLRSIPQVTGIGPGEAVTGSTANNANLNISRANALNIRGLGVQATLTLINGRRVPVGGFGGQLFDPGSIPAIALARIDVVADGASATYGSDAVAGVANLILRTDVDGIEARARYGFADDYSSSALSLLGGKKWDTGRFMIAGEYSWNDQLLQSDRPEFFSCNQLASGGTNNCTFGGAPGNVISGGVRYGLPGGSGVGVTQAQLLTTPNRLENYVYTTAIPANKRFNIVGSVKQELGSGIDVWAEGFVYNRDGRYYVGGPTTGSNGAIPATVTVPRTNPGYVTINGLTTPQTVEYSIFNDLGEGRPAKSSEQGTQIALGANVRLLGDWTLRGWYEYNHNFAKVFRYDELNNTLLTQALACTTPGFCLNPYGTGGTDSNNRAALNQMLGYTQFLAWYWGHIANAQIDGTLVTLPGGEVKLAVGGQYFWEKFKAFNTTNSGTGPTSLSDIRVTGDFGRKHTIKSVFAELVVPLVGDGNAMPFVRKLELIIAGRHDSYSDVGSTTNPKFGIKWEPVEGLTLRGSYGKSFRAPTLTDVDPLSTVSLGASTTAVAGKNVLTRLGGNADVKPEKATTWSFGIEARPSALPGFFASLGYFNIDYRNVIDTPGNSSAAFTDPALAPFVIFNPTVQQINDLIVTNINAGLYRPVTAFALFKPDGSSNVYAISDGRKVNTGRIRMRGLDFQFAYQFSSSFGDWNLGLSGTRVFQYLVNATPASATVERVNQANFPLKFKARGAIGWRSGGLSVNTFYNYTNAYRVVGQVAGNQFTPALAAGVLQDERVAANLTVDATVTYAFGDESPILRGLSLSLSAQNLFDKAPPFARVSNSQEYDSGNASVLGRMVSIELRKKF